MGAYTLRGKRALITGGGRGIGREIAWLLAAEGARVAVAARTSSQVDAVAETVRKRGGEALAITADVSDEKSVNQMVAQTSEAFGGIDILVNNAALIRGRGAVAELDTKLWKEILDVNLTGYFLCTKAVLPGMIEQQSGSIIMVSSTSGKRGDPGGSAYNASKFGVMGLAHALTYEVRKHNIRVHVVCPSMVDTTSDPATAREEGKGAKMHAVDVAEIIVATLRLPPRTLVREIELWGTNP